MYDTNKPIHKTETLTQTEQHTCGCQDGVGKDWEFGIIRRKLLHIGWINNRPLLYGTGNDI